MRSLFFVLVTIFRYSFGYYYDYPCWQNTDCGTSTMYCYAGMCKCTSQSVKVESYCYKIINPGESGCQYESQCQAAWPNTRCNNGKCECLKGYRAEQTRDGYVCVPQIGSDGALISPGACPLPDIRFPTSILNGLALQFSGNHVRCAPGNTGKTAGKGCFANGQYVGDMYDCIPGTNGTVANPTATSGSGQGVCCPNKAFVCSMPRMTGGNSGTSHTRYYYNNVAGECQSYNWRDGGVSLANTNANNFGTIEHCETYCKTVCNRGNPEYETVGLDLRGRTPKICWGSGCGGDHECTGSQDTSCCPTHKFICSARGGRSYSGGSTPDQGFQPLKTPTTMYRWHFDEKSGRCRSFSYFGAGGNFNNFYTHQDCENYCDRALCPKGRPLKRGSFNQGCSRDSDCPTSHTCNKNVCCPKDEYICNQGKVIGGCQGAIPRFWYNKRTTECELFSYSGCMGTDNNFRTYEECTKLRFKCHH